jgi:hypothetical protein
MGAGAFDAGRKGVRMQRSFLIPALAALTFALALPAAAVAGPVNGPPSFHDRTVEDFVDDDFCGTGADVSVHFEGRATVWEAEDASKVLFSTKSLLTYNGVTLVDQVAGRTVAIDVAPQGGAAETVEVIETGLRAKLRLANGKVLTSDHGLLHYFVSFDANGEFLGVDVVRDRGGHPAFGSDVWCEAATAAFGIPFPG